MKDGWISCLFLCFFACLLGCLLLPVAMPRFSGRRVRVESRNSRLEGELDRRVFLLLFFLLLLGDGFGVA
jgi:hypothetical protein